jgi:hypothetical protein
VSAPNRTFGPMSMPVPALGGITNLRQTLGAHDHRTTGAGVRCFPGAQPLAHSPWRTAPGAQQPATAPTSYMPDALQICSP